MARKKIGTKRPRRPEPPKVGAEGEASLVPLVKRRPGARIRSSRTVRFDYLKSTLFRVILADGFHGGLTPSGKVHLAVFNERRPIARSETYRVTPQSTLGQLEYSVERDAIVREVEASLVMDIDKAVALHGWLSRLFKQVEELQANAKAQRKRRS